MGRFNTNGAGKGSSYRPVDKKKFADNWDKVFKKNGKDERSTD